jgi:hypothetical protein
MSDLGPWLDDRSPPPPRALRSAIDRALEHTMSREAESEKRAPQGDVLSLLAESADDCLAAAAATPGRVRRAAFELLAADALLTYACEAALETADPKAALASLCARSDEQAP